MPCRDMLSQLREAHPDILALGAGVLAVATGAGFQAQRLMRDGLPFPALVDPDKNLYRALGIERIRWDRLIGITSMKRYVGSVRRARQGRLTGDILQAPGVVILDSESTIRYVYRGTTLGDYPPLAVVLEALRAVVT